MTHINTLKLHQLRLGELGAEEEGRLRTHLADCALCAARLRHQADTRTTFQRQPMPDALVPRPSWWERARSWLPAAALVPALLAAAVVLRGPAADPAAELAPVLATSPPAESTPAAEATAPVPVAAPEALPASAAPEARPAASAPAAPAPVAAPAVSDAAPAAPPAVADDGLRSKGSTPRLEAWVQSGDSARPLYLGEALGAGSKIQLRYDPRGRAFVTLAGRDSNGVVEVYGTVPAKGEGLTAAPFALTLDASAGEQAFFALCTDERPNPEAVKAAVGHNPVRLDGALVASVVVRKD